MKMLDLFSGIGGFHLGLEQAGFKFDWVGFSEIDKYANEQYKRRFPGAKQLGSVTDVQPGRDTPANIDLLCGGFPCQSFSIAGLRGGFEDTRGTLFFEIVRILRYYKDSGNPIPCFILENVNGLLSHADGKTFATIYGVLADLNYSVECQLLNTRWFLPQNRERIYIVGHSRGESRQKVFPIREIGNEVNELQGQFTNTLPASPSQTFPICLSPSAIIFWGLCLLGPLYSVAVMLGSGSSILPLYFLLNNPPSSPIGNTFRLDSPPECPTM